VTSERGRLGGRVETGGMYAGIDEVLSRLKEKVERGQGAVPTMPRSRRWKHGWGEAEQEQMGGSTSRAVWLVCGCARSRAWR